MINIRRKLEIQRETNSGRRGAEIQAWTEGRVVNDPSGRAVAGVHEQAY